MIRRILLDGEIREWKIVMKDFGKIRGKLKIKEMEYGGNKDEEVKFEIEME